MKKIVVSVMCGVVMTFVLLEGSVQGQTPPPPPPPSYIPPTIALPPSIFSTATPTPQPTATPTATPTSTPIPLRLNVTLAHKSLAPGKKQKVTVTTAGGASVQYVVQFPNKHKKTHSTTAGASGKLSWSYTQPANTTTSRSRTASVRVNVTLGDQHKTSKKTYAIGPGK
ncbi:MAG TPA: hypothetical protein VF221_00610 [Chloroflexota bacterium]